MERAVIWGLLVLVVAAALYPVVRERARQPPATVPGSLADLPQGRTLFRWIGPVRGPVIVAIHGLTTPSGIWDPLAEGLGGLGYRVLVYDLFGRGGSDTVAGRQDADFHVQQLEELLADQGLADNLTLMGYSMGGAVATAFAARHPERMRRVILLAPAGIEMTQDGLHRVMRTWPLIGDWLHGTIEPLRMRAALRTGRAADPALTALQSAQLDRRGFLPSVLASRRGVLADRQAAEHRAIGIADIPVVAVWGDADTLIPVRGVGTLAQWNRNARQEVIAGAGHGLVTTHVDQIVDLLRQILREG